MSATNATIGTTANPGVTWTIQNTNSAKGGRFHDLLFMVEGSSTNMVGVRPGVLPGPADSEDGNPTCWLVEPSSAMTCTVRAGAAVVERDTMVGPYPVVSESSVEITFDDADATNDRIDRVDLQVLDGALGDNGDDSQTALVVTTGRAAGSPSVPDAPENSIPICQVAIDAGTDTITDGMITMQRKSTALRGGVRVLLEGDSLDDPGFTPGELRDARLLGGTGIDQWDNENAEWVALVSRDNVTSALLGDAQYEYTRLDGTINDVTGTGFFFVSDTDGNSAGVAFVAPPSGKVVIRWGLNAFSGAPGSSTLLVGTAVKAGATVGAGAAVSDVVDAECLQFAQTDTVPGCRERPVSGLTPGNSYNVRQSARNTGSTTSTLFKPWVSVTPVLA